MAEITTERIEHELTHDGVTMAVVSLDCPVASGLPKKAERRINAFYKHHTTTLLRRVKKRVLPAAIAEYALSLNKSVPFKPFEITLRFTVTYNGGDVLSIYREFHLRGGGTRQTTRFGDTWSAVTGWFLGLDNFFPPGAKYRKMLLRNAAEIAEKQENKGTHRYYGNLKRLIKKNFSPDSFYLTNNGVAIFYDELSIAPQTEGIPVFTLNTGLDELSEY